MTGRHVDTGATDQTIRVWGFDNAGAAVTGLTTASAGISVTVTVWTNGRPGTPDTLTLTTRDVAGTHKDSAFTEIGAGEYAIDLPDGKVATDGTRVTAVLAADAITGAAYCESLEVSDSVATALGTGSGLTALATAANLGTALDRLGYTLAILAGACADPQTAAETYTITLGADTFTVDYTSLDSTGTRGTSTLTKT